MSASRALNGLAAAPDSLRAPAPGPCRNAARRIACALIATLGVLFAAMTLAHPLLLWSWNFSTSLPGSLYVTVRDRLPQPGDLVTYRWPGGFGYPQGSLFHKRVAGRAGDAISWQADRVSVAGVPLGRALARTRDARPLAPLAAATVSPGHYFVHTAHPQSFDSRYANHGLVSREQIVGTAWRVF